MKDPTTRRDLLRGAAALGLAVDDDCLELDSVRKRVRLEGLSILVGGVGRRFLVLFAVLAFFVGRWLAVLEVSMQLSVMAGRSQVTVAPQPVGSTSTSSVEGSPAIAGASLSLTETPKEPCVWFPELSVTV